MKITFLGAAGEVTGSQHLIESGALRFLLDCGLFQGHRAEARRKNERFRCKPETLDAVILSHAHIDHCGNLPNLYRHGFRGPIFCTPATADVAAIMLRDSARIQVEDARYLRKHLRPGHPPLDPLYEEEHVRKTIRLFEPLDYGDWHELSPDFRLRFLEAGHILGSAIVEIDLRDQGDVRRIVFTGDLGRRDSPLLHDPQLVEGCEVLLCECTYGNKIHPPAQDLKAHLLRVILRAEEIGGRVVIPAFSLGRTQQVLYYLNQLTNEGRFPPLPVFVDSPLSTRLTDVYWRNQDLLNDRVQDALKTDEHVFDFPMLTFVENQQESKALNRRRGAFVVISASGMCENGRIRHHLKHALPDENNTIVLIGYQAANTLGRRLFDGAESVMLFDRKVPVRARVEVLNGLSAHADAEDFRWWFEHLAKHGGVGKAFLVHGEPESAQSMASLIHDYCDEEPVIPELYESYDV